MTGGRPLQAHDPSAVGEYRLLARLGEGGQGVVFLAEDASGEQVAVKCLKVRFDADPKARERFVAEVAAAQRVAEFCTARVLDADLDGSVPYLVSEFVDGVSLLQAVRRDGVRTGSDLERLAIGTATALVAIHQAKVVHRDFKPGNVLLSAQGPRVVDFGLSRILEGTAEESSQVVGTPAYMAPELLADGPIGPAVDIFSWGCTIVFAATGQSPFAAGSIQAIMQRISLDEPDLGDLHGPLRDLVVRCLDKDPARRPSSEDLLLSLLRGEPQSEISLAAGAAAAAKPLSSSRRVRRAATTAGMVVGAAGAAALVTAALLSTTEATPDDDGPALPGAQPTSTTGKSESARSPGTGSSAAPRVAPPPSGASPEAVRTTGGTKALPERATGTTTYKWASTDHSPQLKKTSCLYRIRYGNFGNAAFAQVRTYTDGCGRITVSVYGQSGSFSGTWSSSKVSVQNGEDGCGAYVEHQATSSPNHIATGMAVTFTTLGTTRFLYESGKALTPHRTC